MEKCLVDLEPQVTPVMNTKLLHEFTEADVEVALSHMHPLKSPRPDGFSAWFYKRFLSTMHSEVCKAVLDFVNFGLFDESMNTTHIVLIPRKKVPPELQTTDLSVYVMFHIN